MLMNKSRCRQRGVTLVELMIGMLIGLLVIAIVGTVFINIVRSSSDTLHSIKLNDELRSGMNYMVADIRRAGFWSEGAAAANDPNIEFVNPFTSRDPGGPHDARDVWIHDNGTCLMYSYDEDPSADPPLLGYSLIGSEIKAVEPGEIIPTSGGTDTCAEDSLFETLTDPNVVTITGLTFSTEGSQCRNTSTGEEWAVSSASIVPACSDGVGNFDAANAGDLLIETRQIGITIRGEHAQDPDVEMTLNGSIKVRNNRVLVK